MNVVLFVHHQGKPKMVGKIIKPPNFDGPIFLHEDKSGSQVHRKLNSPGGVDDIVLHYLNAVGVRWVYHYQKTLRLVWTAAVEDFLELGVAQRSGGRARHYLPYNAWMRHQGGLPFKVPWVNDRKVLAPDAAAELQQLPGVGEAVPEGSLSRGKRGKGARAKVPSGPSQ